MLKRTISAIIIAAFLSTQCGISYALRNQGAEGSAVGKLGAEIGAPIQALGTGKPLMFTDKPETFSEVLHNFYRIYWQEDTLSYKILHLRSLQKNGRTTLSILPKAGRQTDGLAVVEIKEKEKRVLVSPGGVTRDWYNFSDIEALGTKNMWMHIKEGNLQKQTNKHLNPSAYKRQAQLNWAAKKYQLMQARESARF